MCTCWWSKKDKYILKNVITNSNTPVIGVVARISEIKNGDKTNFNQNPTIDPDNDSNPRPDEETGSIEDVSDEHNRKRYGILSVFDRAPKKSIQKYPKTPDDDRLIKEAFEKNEFVNKIMKNEILQDIVDAMYNREIKAKELVIREGEKGEHMYVSITGTYEVSIKKEGIISTFDDVRVFGELALLYNEKRLATIRALTPGRVWVLDNQAYQQIIRTANVKEREEILEFVRGIPHLNTVGNAVLDKVASLFKIEFFPAGTVIVRQGDRGDKFYIIRAGTVTISKERKGVIGKYTKGQYFGELALLGEDCRQATVQADSPGVECLTLTRQFFIDHFGDVQDLSKLHLQTAPTSMNVASNITEYDDVKLDDFKIIKTLGVGGFGRVELAQHKTRPNLMFALKYLKKIDMLEQHQEEHVYNEKNIQMGCRSNFIIRLYRTYKDTKYIYFLMELCLGGDLWALLQKQDHKKFEERDARFIAACVLEAIIYLHHESIVYRDLKPENLLIDRNGYIKLTDFGFAKRLGTDGARTFTFAGTPEYVAPEIVLNRGHDKAVDYWAFGIFVHELLTGRTPFRTNDSSHMKTYTRILSGIDNVEFPRYVSYKARNLIERLCRPLPTERLGCLKNGTKDIRNHKWFLGFEWARLNEGRLEAPFVPNLRSPTDTRYFEQFKKDTDVPPDELSGWDDEF